MNQSVRGFARGLNSRQRLAHVIAARIDGTGTVSVVSGSTELTMSDNGVGDWTLTFRQPFARIPVVTATAVNAAAVMMAIVAVSATAVQIKAWDAAGAAIDTDWHVQIVGSDAADET